MQGLLNSKIPYPAWGLGVDKVVGRPLNDQPAHRATRHQGPARKWHYKRAGKNLDYQRCTQVVTVLPPGVL